jgi:hypothetical protein
MVGTYTGKISAYADDPNIIVKLTYENLLRIKNIIEEFGLMSGLICNIEKTVLMVEGKDTILDEWITNLGFNIDTSVTILGVTFVGKGNMEETFKKLGEK